MIRLILLMLMGALGYDTRTSSAPVRLQKRADVEPSIMKVNPLLIVVGLGVLMVLFAVFCFAFMPGTESGVYYHYKP